MWITVESSVVGNWYRKVKGLDDSSKIRYEDPAQNYLLNHLHLLRSEPVQSFWVEDKLRDTTEEELKKHRADIIVEYADQIWLIEVKGHNAELRNIFENKKSYNAVRQLRYYERRVKELGWWKDKEKELQKVVFWCHSTKDAGNERIPIKLSDTSKWPVCRNHC